MATNKKGKDKDLGSVVAELDNIKRLLILQLITSGVQANDIAKALRVAKSTISKLVPAREVKKLS